jgi:hypothetical protein
MVCHAGAVASNNVSVGSLICQSLFMAGLTLHKSADQRVTALKAKTDELRRRVVAGYEFKEDREQARKMPRLPLPRRAAWSAPHWPALHGFSNTWHGNRRLAPLAVFFAIQWARRCAPCWRPIIAIAGFAHSVG